MRTTTKLLACLALLTLSFNTTDSGVRRFKKMGVKDYVNKFKYIAMSEMKRTNVPASITLAQGILESRSGNSYLTQRSKNHFGIKCHEWKGGRAYAKDDTKRDCFRIYSSDRQSFIDHSDFLASNSRYAKLFQLGSLNYKQWAEGLREAGYATDKKYARNLIAIIERYKLHQYDRSAKYTWTDPINYGGVKTVFLAHNSYLWEIGSIYDVPSNKLRLYNSTDGAHPIPAHTPVFLENPKRKRTAYLLSDSSINMVNTSVKNITALYGLGELEISGAPTDMGGNKASGKPATLPGGHEAPSKKTETGLTAQTNGQTETPGLPAGEFAPELAKSTKTLKPVGDFKLIKEKAASQPKRSNTFTVKHTVKRHETLYRLSKRYNTSVQAIATRNGLQGNNIKVGQVLLIKANEK